MDKYLEEKNFRSEAGRQVINFFAVNLLETLYNELMGIPQQNELNTKIGVAIHGITDSIFGNSSEPELNS